MLEGTSFILWGAALATSVLGFARGRDIAALSSTAGPNPKRYFGTAAQATVAVAGGVLTWFGTYTSSQPLLAMRDPGTMLTLAQVTAATVGLFLGLFLGALVGFAAQKLLGRFLD